MFHNQDSLYICYLPSVHHCYDYTFLPVNSAREQDALPQNISYHFYEGNPLPEYQDTVVKKRRD
jgi:hypothetical protein